MEIGGYLHNLFVLPLRKKFVVLLEERAWCILEPVYMW
jgi:hypothetical protein